MKNDTIKIYTRNIFEKSFKRKAENRKQKQLLDHLYLHLFLIIYLKFNSMKNILHAPPKT